MFPTKARSRSCTGRLERNTDTRTPLNADADSNRYVLEERLSYDASSLVKLKTDEERSENGEEITCGATPVASTASFQINPMVEPISGNRRSSCSVLDDSLSVRDPRLVRPVASGQAQISLQSCDIHHHIDTPKPDDNIDSAQSGSPAGKSISALVKFEEMFPQAKQWFDKGQNKCLWQIGKKAKYGQCGNLVAATNRILAKEHFETLKKTSFPEQILETSQYIGKIVDLIFCKRHHYLQARAKVHDSLRGDLLQSQGGLILDSSKSENEQRNLHKAIDSSTNVSPSRRASTRCLTACFVNTSDDRFSFEQSPIPRRSGRGRNNTPMYAYIPKFIPRRIPAKARADHGEWIFERAKRDFKPSELGEGYIYAYWNRTTFGFCKIGCTAKDVDHRLREWETKCKHKAERIYPPRDGNPVIVPYVKRVEALIHRDLVKYRFEERGCRGCGHDHVEWFQGIAQDLLKAKIDAWTQWIRSEPYEHTNGQLVLRKSAEDALRQICRQSANSLLPQRRLSTRLGNHVCHKGRRSLLPTRSNSRRIQNPQALQSYDLRSKRISAQ